MTITARHKRLLLWLAVIIGSYLWGVLTVYRQIFPFDQLRVVKQKVSPEIHSEHGENLRKTLFQIFSPPVEVVMIGDSITEGGVWNEMFPEIRIANRGVHGDSTKAIVQRMDTILAVQPRKAFIMAGINDINEGTPLETIFQNYLKIIRQLRAERITVYIQSTLECSRNVCGEQLDQVRKLNKKLLHYALSNNIVFIDLNEGLTSANEGLLDKFTVDGVHLRGGAYINWRRKLAPFILGDSPNSKRPEPFAESPGTAENRTESGIPAFHDKPPENGQKTF